MELFTLGIDLGKTTFHVVGMNQSGEVVVRKRFSRVQLLHFTSNLKVKLFSLFACDGAADHTYRKRDFTGRSASSPCVQPAKV